MEKKIPVEYETKKIQLDSFGFSGFAWKKEDFLQFLNDEKTNDFAILGGDVLSFNNGKIAYTYDSWFIPERPKTQSFELFCKRTREVTLEYVKRYPTDLSIIFSPVITSESTAGWWML